MRKPRQPLHPDLRVPLPERFRQASRGLPDHVEVIENGGRHNLVVEDSVCLATRGSRNRLASLLDVGECVVIPRFRHRATASRIIGAPGALPRFPGGRRAQSDRGAVGSPLESPPGLRNSRSPQVARRRSRLASRCRCHRLRSHEPRNRTHARSACRARLQSVGSPPVDPSPSQASVSWWPLLDFPSD